MPLPQPEPERDPEPFEQPQDPGSLLAMRVEYLREVLASLDPREAPTIYIDPERFPTEFAKKAVLERYHAQHPGVEFSVRLVGRRDLEHWAFDRSSAADERFRLVGHIANVEFEGLGRGGKNPTSTHLARNEAAVSVQMRVVALAYAAYDGTNKTFKPPAGNDPARVQAFDRLEEELCRLCGEKRAAPLTLRNEVLLPTGVLRGFPNGVPDTVYFTPSTPLETHMRHGVEDRFCLMPASREEIAEQVWFEYDHSPDLFSGATRSALALWQTQALGYLRIGASVLDFFASKSYNELVEKQAAKLRREAARATWRADLAAGRIDLDDIAELESPVGRALRDRIDEYRDDLRGQGVATPLDVAFAFGLTPQQHFVAALHGATVGPLTFPRPVTDEDIRYAHCKDPVRLLNPIGAWIGALKRERYAVLDLAMARTLADVVSDDEGQGLRRFLPMIDARFGPEASSVLVEAIQDLLADEAHEPVEIAYEWSRDLAAPWAAERIDAGKIRMRGPLLDFPVHEVEAWNVKAQELWRADLQRFEFAPPPRRG